MNHYPALLASICDAPTDDERWERMRILAGWLYEECDERAEAWLWLAENHMRPFLTIRKWVFWRTGFEIGFDQDRLHFIPEEMKTHMKDDHSFGPSRGSGERPFHGFLFFDGIPSALEAAVTAYLAAKADGWKPTWPERKTD